MTKPNRIQSWQLGGDPRRAVAIRRRLPCQYLSKETSTEKRTEMFSNRRLYGSHEWLPQVSVVITLRIIGAYCPRISINVCNRAPRKVENSHAFIAENSSMSYIYIYIYEWKLKMSGTLYWTTKECQQLIISSLTTYLVNSNEFNTSEQ